MPKKRTEKVRKINPEREQEEGDEKPSTGLFGLRVDTLRGIMVVALFLLAMLSLLSFFQVAGPLGRLLENVLKLVFGWARFSVPFLLLLLAYFLLFPKIYTLRIINFVGMFFLQLSLASFLHLSVPSTQWSQALAQGRGGGYLGFVLAWPLLKALGIWAGGIFLVALFIVALLLMLDISLTELAGKQGALGWILRRLFVIKEGFYEWLSRRSGSDEEENDASDDTVAHHSFGSQELDTPTTEPEKMTRIASDIMKEDVKKRRAHPKVNLPFDLLDKDGIKPRSGDIEYNKHKIKSTLESFGIDVEMGDVNVGPTVTQYTLKPAEGIKLSQITTLQNDLSLSLAVHPIRIEAPIPGKALVGIEIPNKTAAVVNLREVLESDVFKKRESQLSIALGEDVAGNSVLADLESMPHMLVAGSTGSGKSVCLNSILISLLYQNQPEDLKFILVDPKRVELIGYNGIPHLMTPVIVDVDKTINALKWAVNEMDRRYHLLSAKHHRNIASYNESLSPEDEKMCYIIIIIDELADLMAVAAADVEAAVIRLAQMARAVGIHLVLSTQRPSVNVITGLIKANITARVAFTVASQTDSRTILDMSGAEKLLGKGDMLYISAELSKPKRIQGAYVSDQEIKRVVRYLKEEGGDPDYNEQVVEKPRRSPLGVTDSQDDDYDDSLLDEAKDVVVRAGKASASLLQRRLRIGYARAARILDILEERGVIGPADGAKPREVMVEASDNFSARDFGADEEERADGDNIEEEAEDET